MDTTSVNRETKPNTPIVGIVTKLDKATKDTVGERLLELHELLGADAELVPVSATEQVQIDVLLDVADYLEARVAAAEAAGIAPGEYAEFAINAGPLPTPGDLVLPAKQTYSDGEVADWSDVAEEGGEEPEHPAPSFEVTAAEEGGHHATAADDLSEDFDTIGGLVAHKMGHVPKKGEHHALGGFDFVVLHTKGGAVRWFRVSPARGTGASD